LPEKVKGPENGLPCRLSGGGRFAGVRANTASGFNSTLTEEATAMPTCDIGYDGPEFRFCTCLRSWIWHIAGKLCAEFKFVKENLPNVARYFWWGDL